MPIAKSGLPLIVLLALAACASGRPPPPAGAPPRLAGLFVSPAGEPFRAPPGGPYPVAAWFAGADADKDGRLTPAEFAADAQRFVRSLDRNGDGVVDGFELGDYEHALPELSPQFEGARPEGPQAGPGPVVRGRQGGRRRGAGPAAAAPRQAMRGAGLPRGAAAFGLLNDPQPVAGADRDLDGRVSLDEARWTAERRFAQLDRDKDGVLTMAELPRTPVQAAARRAVGGTSAGDGTAPPRR